MIYNKYIFGLCLVPISDTEFIRSLEFPVLREECCYIDEVTFGKPLGTKGMRAGC